MAEEGNIDKQIILINSSLKNAMSLIVYPRYLKVITERNNSLVWMSVIIEQPLKLITSIFLLPNDLSVCVRVCVCV